MKLPKILFGLLLILAPLRSLIQSHSNSGFNFVILILFFMLSSIGVLLIRKGIQAPKLAIPYFWMNRIGLFILNTILIVLLLRAILPPY